MQATSLTLKENFSVSKASFCSRRASFSYYYLAELTFMSFRELSLSALHNWWHRGRYFQFKCQLLMTMTIHNNTVGYHQPT